MRHTSWCASLLGLALALFMSVGAAQAQATRTWVSGVGDDANPCSRTAPCKTFPGAISKTAAGGEINVLDPGGFGAVTITKSITITSEGFEGGVLVSGTNAIIINAGASDVITLKGLDIEGLGTGINGISFLGGGALHVLNSRIKHFTGNGINFVPSTGNPLLFVDNCYIQENGSGAALNGGILFRPTGAATATFSITGTKIADNRNGLRIDSSAPSGTINGVLRDSNVSGNLGDGVSVLAGANAATVTLDRVGVSGNNNGLKVRGAAATIVANETSVTGNGTGLMLNPNGVLASFKNNAVSGNTTNGTFTNFITPQ